MRYIQLMFLIGEYVKPNEILKDLLKKQSKNELVLYWQGLIAFYAYHSPNLKESERKSKAKLTENTLLRI